MQLLFNDGDPGIQAGCDILPGSSQLPDVVAEEVVEVFLAVLSGKVLPKAIAVGVG